MTHVTVIAADNEHALDQEGAAIVMPFDFVGEAQRYAKHLVTEEYRVASESSTILGIAQVIVDGEVRHAYYAKETK